MEDVFTFTWKHALYLLALCVSAGLGGSVPKVRSKRETLDLTPGNWDSCKTADGVVPPTRVNTTAQVAALRALFHANNIDAYIIPSEDAHQSEYPSDHDLRRGFISGFSGSAGMAVVTYRKAGLWADGRYYIQAAAELDCNWILFRTNEPGVPTVTEWLNAEFAGGGKVGASPFLISAPRWESYLEKLDPNVTLVSVIPELIDKIWTEGRPPAPNTPINALPLQFAGRSWQDKVNDTLTEMADKRVDLLIVTGLDETAWLFNMRASDIAYNPFFLSYAVIDRPRDQVTLYLLDARRKLTQAPTDSMTTQTVQEHLNTGPDGDCTGRTGRCVTVKEYSPSLLLEDIQARVDGSDVRKVWASLACNHAIVNLIPEPKRHMDNTPLTTSKSKKNPTEVEGMRNAHIRDAVAVIAFLARLETGVKKGDNWTEVSAADELKKLREQQQYNRGESFATISGSGPNGAIVHYKASAATDAAITADQMYLLDSGGQYLDGTTDVTRTLHFGKPTRFEKECYTRVLMGHIDFYHAIWPKGLYGRELNAFARAPLWDVGLVYRHGSGHGIGMFLSVHEGPGRISLSGSSFIPDYPLAENQFFSDEPGFYEDGKFGIRLENILMIKPAKPKYHFKGKEFLTWDHVTLVPYEPNLIEYSLLSEKQVEYLNEYNRRVREMVGPELQRQGKTTAYDWMMFKTEPVPRTSSANTIMDVTTFNFSIVLITSIFLLI